MVPLRWQMRWRRALAFEDRCVPSGFDPSRGAQVARYRVGLETRERILEATRTLLAESGIDGITLKRITAAAEVGVGSFYNLFDSKEAAVFEVIRQALDAVDPHPGRGDGDTLEELIDAFVTFMTGSSTIARIYLQLAGLGLTDPAIAQRVLRSHRRRVQRFAAACRSDDPSLSQEEAREQAETVMAALTGLGLTALIDPSFDMRAHAARLLVGPRTGRAPSVDAD
jgi:AcrR family transcriptional regulator